LFVVPNTISVGSTPSANVIDALRATLYFPFKYNNNIFFFLFFPISFKATHRGINYMNNITSDEQQIHDDTPLTRTQVEALFRELEEQRNREREILFRKGGF
jgi:hypothetical protein